MEQLTDKAKSICAANYKSNCGRCEIRKECIERGGPGYESYNRWVSVVNAAADKVEA